MEKLTRLNKLIGESGFCSRKQADEYLKEGRVIVNGTVADLGTKVTLGIDHIRIDGELLNVTQKMIDERKNLITGWRAERKAKKEEELAQAARNPKSRTLRSGRKTNVHQSTKLDENGKPVGMSRHKSAPKKGRLVTKGAATRMEDAINNPDTIKAVKKQMTQEPVNKKSAALRGKGKPADFKKSYSSNKRSSFKKR